MDYSPYKPIDRQNVEEENSATESKGKCDFCQDDITDDQEERRIGEILLCEVCGSHYLD